MLNCIAIKSVIKHLRFIQKKECFQDFDYYVDTHFDTYFT